MKGTEAIQTALRAASGVLSMYLSDLSDADLLVRPVPAANHIAWQLGHLISAEPYLVHVVLPDAKYPDFPPGFDEMHTKATAGKDGPSAFLTKGAYLEQFSKVREATLVAVGKLSDADLDKPTVGPMAKFAPSWGAMLILVSNHTLMHAGQFTAVRRKLGKPILF
jgi:hypothetical protein